jgi:hypothetical protein
MKDKKVSSKLNGICALFLRFLLMLLNRSGKGGFVLAVALPRLISSAYFVHSWWIPEFRSYRSHNHHTSCHQPHIHTHPHTPSPRSHAPHIAHVAAEMSTHSYWEVAFTINFQALIENSSHPHQWEHDVLEHGFTVPMLPREYLGIFTCTVAQLSSVWLQYQVGRVLNDAIVPAKYPLFIFPTASPIFSTAYR